MIHPAIAGAATAGIIAVCHRGANRFAPENTLSAAEICFVQGGHYLEIDVRETADGEIVVMHDETVDRTTNGTGAVAHMTWAEISVLDAGTWFAPAFAAQRVPRLHDVIAFCRQWRRGLYIENKRVDPQRLVAEVARLDFLDQCFFWSGDPQLQEGMRLASDTANIKATRKHYLSMAAMRDHLLPQLTEIDFAMFELWAPECIQAGITPMLQYFGDNPDTFRQIVRLRPPMVNLNRVDLLTMAAMELSHAG